MSGTITNWIGTAAGDWSSPTNWNNGTPTASEAAVFAGYYPSLATIGSAETVGANSVTLVDYAATLSVQGTLQTTQGVTLQEGVLEDAGLILGGVTVSGGTFVNVGTGPFTLGQGVVLQGGALSYSNPITGTADVSLGQGGLFTATGNIGANNGGPAQTIVLTNDGTLQTASAASQTETPSLDIDIDTLFNSGLITTTGGNLYLEGGTLDNSGTLSAGPSGELQIYDSFDNTGLITADDAELYIGTNGYGGGWVNTGLISVTSGAVYLGGNETIGDFGSLVLANNPVVYLTGTLENAGGSLNATITVLQDAILDGGTIAGGTLDATALGLDFGNYDNSLYDVTLINGFTLAGGEVSLDDGSTVYTNAALQAVATVVVDPGAVLGFDFDANQTIDQDVSATDATVALNDRFTFAGTIAATGGDIQLGTAFATAPWKNTGVVSVTGGTLIVSGDETLADLGALQLSSSTLLLQFGTLENQGGTLSGADSVLQGLTLQDAAIAGGTLNATALGLVWGGAQNYGYGGTLDGVKVVGGLTLASGSNLTLLDGTEIYRDTAGTTLGTIDVQSGAVLILSGTSAYSIDQPIDVNGGTLILEGPFTLDSHITAENGGLIELGGPIYTTPTTWLNDATISATGATVDLLGDETAAQIGSLALSGSTLTYIGGTLENAGETLNGADASLLDLHLSGATIEGGVVDVHALGLGFVPSYAYYNGNQLLDVAVINGLTLTDVGEVVLGGSSEVYSGTVGSALATITDNSSALLFSGAGPMTLDNSVLLNEGNLGWQTTSTLSTQPVIVTIGSTVTVSGYGDMIGADGQANPSTLINQGTIAATEASEALAVTAGSFLNTGVIESDTNAELIIDQSSGAVTNLGTIDALGYLVVGGTLVNSGHITIDGALAVIGSDTETYDSTTQSYEYIAPSFLNTGTIVGINGQIVLLGDETVADIGSIQTSNSTLYFGGGTFYNTGATLNSADTSLLGLQLAGGTIEGGSIDIARLGFAVSDSDYYGGSQADLDNVTLIGNLTVAASVRITGTTALFANSAHTTLGTFIVEYDSDLLFQNGTNATLDNPLLLQGGEVSWTGGESVDVTIAAGEVVQGYGALEDGLNQAGDSVVNFGTILGDVGYYDLTIGFSTFTNRGLIEATSNNGLIIGRGVLTYDSATESELTLYPSFVNLGTILAAGGNIIIDADETVAELGTIINSAGGVSYGAGTLYNVGSLNGSTTSLLGLELNGGTIDGGTLDAGALGLSFGYNDSALYDVAVINNLTADGMVELQGSSAVYATEAATTPGTITSTADQVSFIATTSSATLINDVILQGGGIGWASVMGGTVAAETVTIAADILVTGYGYISDASAYFNGSPTVALTNLGTIDAVYGYYSGLTINTDTFSNAGTLAVSPNALLYVASEDFTNLSNGTLTGGIYMVQSGGNLTIDQSYYGLPATITTDAASIILSGAAASVSFEATLTQVAAGATLAIDNAAIFAGDTQLVIDGTLSLGGGTLYESGVDVIAGTTLAGYGMIGAAAGVTIDGGLVAAGGALVLQAPLLGAGSVQVADFATLELDGASAEIVAMVGSDSTIRLDNPSSYSGTIEGFINGDQLIIGGFEGTAATWSDGVLTIEGPSGTATLSLAGTFATHAFSASVPSAEQTAVVFSAGQTLSIAAPGTLLDNPGTAVFVPSIQVFDSAGATLTASVQVQYGELATYPADGGVAQGNGTGTLALSGNLAAINDELASLEYEAVGDGHLTDTIIIDVTDQTGATQTALTSVTINQPPTLALPAYALEAPSVAGTIAGLAVSDPDPVAGEVYTVTLADGAGVLRASAVDGGSVIGSGTSHVTLTGALAQVNDDLASLTFTGTADDQLSLTVSDGRGGTSNGFLPVYVDIPPILQAPGSVLADQFYPVALDLSVADTYGSVVGDNFSVILSDNFGTLSDGSATGASLSITGSLAAIDQVLATVTYGATVAGSGTITVAVNDGQHGTASATIAADVVADVTPTIIAPNQVTLTAESALSPGGISVSDSDAIGVGKTLTVTVTDISGSLSAGSYGGTVIGEGSHSLELIGGLAAVNAELGSLTYTGASPGTAPDATATDMIHLSVNDGRGGVSGASVAVTVQQVAYAPPSVSVSGPVSDVSGVAVPITDILLSDSFAQATDGVLNVTVYDLSGVLTATASGQGEVIGSGSNQVVLVGTLADVQAELNSLSYTGGNSASDTITVTVSDAGGGTNAASIAVSVDQTQLYGGYQLALGTYIDDQDAGASSSQIAADEVALYETAVSGALGTAGGGVWQQAYNATVAAAASIISGQTLDGALALFGTLVAGTIGAIAASASQSAYAAALAAASSLTTDIDQANAGRLLADLSALYGTLAAAAGGTLTSASWQAAYDGSVAASDALSADLSGNAGNATILADAASLYQSIITNSLAVIDGQTLAAGSPTVTTIAADIAAGSGQVQLQADLAGLFEAVATIALTSTSPHGLAVVNASVSASAEVIGFDSGIGTANEVLGAVQGGGAALSVDAAATGVDMLSVAAAIGTVDGPVAASDFSQLASIATATDVDAVGSSGSVSAIGGSADAADASVVLGPEGDAEWQEFDTDLQADDATYLAATQGQTGIDISATDTFMATLVGDLLVIDASQSTAAGNELTTAFSDFDAGTASGNGSEIAAAAGAFSQVLTYSSTSGGLSETGALNIVATQGGGFGLGPLEALDIYSIADNPAPFVITTVATVLAAAFAPEALAAVAPYLIAVGVATTIFSLADKYIASLPSNDPLRKNWNSLKRNPGYVAQQVINDAIHKIAHAFGDVHLTTYDGLYYNFQAAGEFTYTQSTLPGDLFDVQVRLQPWNSSAVVSVITQAAVVVGANSLTFDLSNTVRLNGQVLPLDVGQSLVLAGATLVQLTATSWQVNYTTGESVTVSNAGSFMNIDSSIPTADDGYMQGLLGNAAGNPQTDLTNETGTVFTAPLSSAQLYTSFADSWELTQDTSRLYYAPGTSNQTYSDPSFPSDAISLSNVPASVLQNAAAAVAAAGITDPGAAQGALEDFLLTGDPSFVSADAAAGSSASTALVQPDVTSPGAIPGVSIGADEMSVALASPGTTALDFEVYLAASGSVDQVVDYQVEAGGSLFAGGLAPSGTVTIAAGQTAASLVLDVTGNLGDLPSAPVEVMISSPIGTPVLAPSAEINVVSATPVAGIAAAPEFLDPGQVGSFTQNGTAWTLDFGTLYAGDAIAPFVIDVVNQAASGADTLSGALSQTGASVISFPNGLTAISQLGGGQIDPLTAEFDTSYPGTVDTTLTFTPTEDNASGYSAALDPITLAITGTLLVPAPTLVVPGGVLELAGSAALLDGIGIGDQAVASNDILTTVTLSDTVGLFSTTVATGGTISGNGTNQITLGGSLGAVQAELAALTVTATGADQISLTAGNAAGGNAQATVALLIDSAPLITAPASSSIVIGQAGTVSGISITDPNLAAAGDTLTVTLSDPAGLLAVNGQPGASSLTLAGTLAAVNADLATLTDTASGSAATDTVGLVATDPLGLSASADIEVSVIPCFRAGTRVRTPAGEIAVELLAVGDVVLTAKGVARRVIWIGDRRLDCRLHPKPRLVWPVRVKAGAFADGVPSRDLFLSPDHAVFVGGVLVPVRLLVNDATIIQERVGSVHYFHVELESHDVLLAEGLTVESYLDTGNRRSFDAVHPDFSRTADPRACARLVLSGGELAVIRRRLARRMRKPADIHVLVDGRKLLPARSRGHTSSFVLPADASSIEIIGNGVLRSYRSGALLEVWCGAERANAACQVS
jgi:hypothetical protein